MELKNQRVKMFGDDAIMQFSQTGNGSRTIKTKVFDICEATESEVEKIQKEGYDEREFRKKRFSERRTQYRISPYIMDGFKVLIGKSEPSIWGSKRPIKVWGYMFLKHDIYPNVWFSYASNLEEEEGD